MNLFKKIFVKIDHIKLQKVSYVKDGIKPDRDWCVILVSACFTFCVAGVVAYYFFDQINKGKFFSSNKRVTVKSSVINEELLKKTVNEIKDKKESLDRFLLNKVIPPDPSL